MYIYVAANGIITLLWLSNIPLCLYTTFSLSIHLDGHLGCLHVLVHSLSLLRKMPLMNIYIHLWDSLIAQLVKNCLQCRRPGFDSWVEKIPWRRKWQHTPVFLPGKSHGQRSLVVYSPWGHKS